MDDYKHKPGGERAVKNGCTCPVVDNDHGRGHVTDGKPVHFVSIDCPLHFKPYFPWLEKQEEGGDGLV